MKKAVALLMVLLLTVSVLMVTVSAATFPDLTFTLEPDVDRVEPGDTLYVDVSVSQEKYVMGGEFYLTFDANSFEIVDVEGGGLTASNEQTPGVITTSAASTKGCKNPLFTYIFNVKADAPAGTSEFTFATDSFRIYDGTNAVGGTAFGGNFSINNTSVVIEKFGTHSVLKGSDRLEFAIDITKCPNNGVLYAALYKDGKLKDCKFEEFTSPITKKSFYFDSSVDYDSAKVFIWDSNGVPILETPEDVTI